MVATGLPVVLQLARVERNPEPEFILLHVSQDGSRPLDLKLVGTDSSEVFQYSLEHGKTSTLKAKNSKNSPEEWDAILSAILLGEVPEDYPFMEGVEAISEVKEEESMTITIQRRIEGITQRLGQIVLSCEEVEIDIYEWCCLSIKSKNAIKKERDVFKASLEDRDVQMKKLDDALSELTILKNRNEDQLLEKFSLLLNEKKLKIRDQQRLLSTATIDPLKVDAMDMEVEAGPSRPRKRKAGSTNMGETDPEGGVEKMEVDEEPVEDDSDKADEQTASETESDSDALPPASDPKGKAKAKAIPPPKRNTRGASAKPMVESGSNDSPSPPPKLKAKATLPPRRQTRAASIQPVDSKESDDDDLPPKRELPFAKKKPPPKKSSPPPVLEGSETESDDEL